MSYPFTRKAMRMLLAGAAAWTALQADAAPVDPAGALRIAGEFVAEGMSDGVPLRAPSTSPGSVEISYTAAKDGLDCFYVVNYDHGFVIVSADTRLPEVLGYSDNGRFDINRISPNMEWWLSEYSREISAWLPDAPESAVAKKIRRKERATIEPLVSTRWNQDAPYNNDCPLDSKYGARSVTGCVATAMAQLMKYHNWPEKPTGSNAGVTFTGTTLDWANMIDVYEKGKYSGTQAAAVAQLMRQCGAAVNMQYSAYSSGAYDNEVQFALRNYFDYSPDLQMVWKDYTPQSRWNDIVYSELAAKRPVYYSGASQRGGHAFVCDGYSANEYFHFNWGWGGYQDGYFRLTALNPETGGAGSYEGGYNSGQSIITGIRPDDGATEIQSSINATGAFCYDEGRFVVRESIMGDYELFYNPLYYTIDVYFGLKITAADKADANPVFVKCGGQATLLPNYGTTEFSGAIPALEDGVYHIYGVYSADGNHWENILIPLGKQDFVTLTVANGRQSFSNDGPDPNMAPNIIMGTPYSISVISGQAEKYFRIPFINTGKGDYLGEIGMSLFSDNEFGDVISANNSVSIPGKSFTEIEFASSDPVAPGKYRMYVTDNDGNQLSDEYVFDIVDDTLPEPASGNLTAGSLAPNYYVTGDERVLYITFYNNSPLPVATHLNIVFATPADGKIVKEYHSENAATIPANTEFRAGIGPMSLDLIPGDYIWYITDDKNNVISYPSPMIVVSGILSEEGISYIVTDANAGHVSVIAPESNPYSGEITVPEELGGYTVAEIRQDAFAFAGATDVTLPASVARLENGGFYDAQYLRHLTLLNNGIVRKHENTFAPGAKSSIWIGVPDGLANEYARSDYWRNFRFPFWILEPGDGVTFTGLQSDPKTGIPYSPYYVGPQECLNVGVTAPDGMNVRYWTVVDGDWNGAVIDPLSSVIATPALGWIGGRLIAEATNDRVNVATIDTENVTGDVFSIDGCLILRNASDDDLRSLSPGIYIRNGKKFSVR